VTTTERLYRITRAWLERFEQARASAEEQSSALHPRARRSLLDQYDSPIAELHEQLIFPIEDERVKREG
jgi:hypothetical protein